MKGYVVCVYKSITSQEKLKEYAIKARAAVEKHKGRFLIRGGKSTISEGDKSPRTVVIEFPSMERAESFYQSDEYRNGLKYINSEVADRFLNIAEVAD